MFEKINKTRVYFFLGGGLFFLFTVTSCFNDTELKYFGDQISSLNRKVNDLEQSKLDRSELDTNLDPRLQSVQNKQAELGTQVDELKRAEEALTGRVEDNELIIKRAVERDLNTKETSAAKLDELIQRVNHLETLVKRQQQYLNLEEPAIPKEKTGGAGETPVQVEKPEPPQQSAGKPIGEIELYDYSLAAFREDQYEKAMEGFKEFLATYPKSDRADNAQFWIGECFMALKQYEQAILAYQNVIKNYPNGNKVANAMLRQAIAFLEIKDKTSAKLLLQRIIKKYPNSSEADIAGKKLDTLK